MGSRLLKAVRKGLRQFLNFSQAARFAAAAGSFGVVIDFEAEDESHPARLLVEEAVGLVHRHEPVAGDRLVRAVAIGSLAPAQ